MPLALEGLKVIEMGTFGPSNMATGWLGDMGAEVVMIESPSNQAMPPAYREGGPWRAVRSRNKRSIVLNLRKDEAREVLHELARSADVLVEANRPGVAKRLGFDYETLSAINPRIIVCSLTGYGQTGPYAQVPGHGLVWEATGGWLLMHGQGYANMGGDYTGVPWLNYFNLPDMKGAINTMAAILLALYAREKHGVGQYLDMALVDGVVAVREPSVAPEGDGAFARITPAWNVYECKDGKYIALSVAEDLQWVHLCDGLGTPQFAKERGAAEPRAQEIIEAFRGIFKTRTRDEWFDYLSPLDTEVAKVNSIDEAQEDPQVKLRGLHVKVKGNNGQEQVQYGTPFHLSRTPGRAVHEAAPRLGQHTDQILAEMGYSEARIALLRQDQAVI